MPTTQAAAAVSVDDRASVIRQDLQKLLHPVVPHRQLEAEPLVIAEGRGSTVVDADATEYLDAMAGVWWVRGRLLDHAAVHVTGGRRTWV